jgi:hypothetical protein
MSAQFIRCVSNLLRSPKPLRRNLALFRGAQMAYLWEETGHRWNGGMCDE